MRSNRRCVRILRIGPGLGVLRPPLEPRAPSPCFPIVRPLPAGGMMQVPDKEAAWMSSNESVVIGAGSLA